MTSQTILIIEDESDYRDIAGQILEQAGFKTRAASDAESGLQALESELPDLVLLDVGLPDRLGTELCEQLRASPRYKDLPVILFTVRSEISQVSEALSSGADDYILKPFEAGDFLARVRNVLESKHKP